MSTHIKYFSIPALDPGHAEEAMNRFLDTVTVIHIREEFVSNGFGAYWAVAVRYQPESASEKSKRKRIDFKERLSHADFVLYAKLRDWRKAEAERTGTQLYLIFTNAQLAEIAEKRMATKSDLLQLEGVGEARVNKYADAVAAIVRSVDGDDAKEPSP